MRPQFAIKKEDLHHRWYPARLGACHDHGHTIVRLVDLDALSTSCIDCDKPQRLCVSLHQVIDLRSLGDHSICWTSIGSPLKSVAHA